MVRARPTPPRSLPPCEPPERREPSPERTGSTAAGIEGCLHGYRFCMVDEPVHDFVHQLAEAAGIPIEVTTTRAAGPAQPKQPTTGEEPTVADVLRALKSLAAALERRFENIEGDLLGIASALATIDKAVGESTASREN